MSSNRATIHIDSFSLLQRVGCNNEEFVMISLQKKYQVDLDEPLSPRVTIF